MHIWTPEEDKISSVPFKGLSNKSHELLKQTLTSGAWQNCSRPWMVNLQHKCPVWNVKKVSLVHEKLNR